MLTRHDRTPVGYVQRLVPLSGDGGRIDAPMQLLRGRQGEPDGRVFEKASQLRDIARLHEVLAGHLTLLNQVGERSSTRDRGVGLGGIAAGATSVGLRAGVGEQSLQAAWRGG